MQTLLANFLYVLCQEGWVPRAPALGYFGTETKVPPKDVLMEGETDGLGWKSRATAIETAPSAPDWLSRTPA